MRNKLLPMLLLLFASPFLTGIAQQAMIQDDREIQPYRHSVESAGPANTLAMWSSVSKIPVPKKYHAVASLNGTIYLFAGCTANNYFDNKCYKYNTATDTWTQIANFPVASWIFGQAQAVNGKIYLFSGLSNINTAYAVVKSVWEYDPAADSYRAMASLPFDQGFVTSGVINNKIYVICGSGTSNTEYVKRVQVFDPAANSWGTATNYPRDVRYASAATVNNTIIVSGGYNVNYTPLRYIADTYIGSDSSGILVWHRVKDYPIGPTIYMSGAGVGDKALFFGGRPSIDNNAPATQRTFRYTPATDAWETLELKPTGVQTLIQAGVAGTKVYAPGGEDANAAAVDVTEVFDVTASGGPALVLSVTSLLVPAKTGGTASRSITIKNNGPAQLDWSVAVNPASSWVSPGKTSGSVPGFGSDILTLQFNTGVATGEYHANLVVTSNDPAKPSVSIPITFVVQDQDIDTAPILLFEEGTGTWCGYCPYGADSVHALEIRYPEQVVGISYHGGQAGEPMYTPITDTWVNQIGLTGWPSGALNRIQFEGNQNIALIDRSQWSGLVGTVLASYRSPVSINVNSATENPTTRQINLNVSVFFHQPMAVPIRLSIAQVEDNLNWTQTFYPPSGGSTKIYPYYHQNVLRQMYPDAFGTVINDGSYIQSQSTVTKSFSFASRDSLPQNSRLILIVHISDGQSYGMVLQNKEIPLTALTGVYEQAQPAAFSLAQNYPNPFNPGTVISYSLPAASQVTLKVTDMLGREVRTLVNGRMEAGTHTVDFDASALPSGFYLYTLKAGGSVQSRKMLLMK